MKPYVFAPLLAGVMFAGCGQAPSFVENGEAALSDFTDNVDGTSSDDDSSGDSTANTSGSGDGTSGGTSTGGGEARVFTNGSTASGETPDTFVVPGLDPNDAQNLQRCLTKWGKTPFKGVVTNFKRIKASVTVYGIGNPVNDTTQTAEPALILVDAGVNVMGTPTYNLLNNNGYYCVSTNVNVKTQLNVNLACDARLADNSLQVDVNSSSPSSTASIGVNVGSDVQVNRMAPNGATCTTP